MKTLKRLALGLATLASVASAHAAGSLVVGSAGDLRSFYPAGSTENANLTIQQQVYEGLLAWTEKGDVAPMLATSLPTVSADNLTYTFTLRDKIKFHDGTPLTAQAAAKSWNFLLDAKTGWPCRQYFNGSGAIHITEVVATGPLQLQVKLEKPSAGLLTQMARADCASGGIMAEAVYTEPKASRPIGTGPFMIQSIQPGQKIVLVPFKEYQSRSEPADGYAGKKQAMVDTLTFQIIPDPAANNSALLAGAIDIWYGINPAYAKDLAS
ncbi:MAG: transporter substrate-binding protein, partial [Rhizobacter sp.]|nr:transporter substrate-binding protein [Rhizobacter sp.]